MRRVPKKKDGVRGGEGRKCLQTNPWILKTMFANEQGSWLAGVVEHCWHVLIKGLLKRSECRKEGEDAFEACLQNALTFLTEWGFSRELRQYGKNPMVQCRCFGILKPSHYCRSNCNTICSCSFNFNITFMNATCAKSHYCVEKPSDFVWLVTWHAFGFHHVGTLTFH